jgi:predicted phage tail protein
MKRKIILEGEIGEKFGREFTINADSFKDVVQCLNGNFPEFQKYLIEADERNIGFTCHVGEAPLTDERELFLNSPEGAMVISALPAGSKSAGAKIFAAIALTIITAGAFAVATYGMAAVSAMTFGQVMTAGLWMAGQSLLGMVMLGTAINLALTGLQQMMAPDPSTDSQQSDESYLFQGTTQEAVEGDPVPIVYGKLRVPGRPISSQIKNERQVFINMGSDTSPATPSPQEDNPAETLPPAQYSLGLGQIQKYYSI